MGSFRSRYFGKLRPRIRAGRTRRHQRADFPGTLAHQPETVTADPVHVRDT